MTNYFLPEHSQECMSSEVEISSRTTAFVNDDQILWINDLRSSSTKQMDHAFWKAEANLTIPSGGPEWTQDFHGGDTSSLSVLHLEKKMYLSADQSHININCTGLWQKHDPL